MAVKPRIARTEEVKPKTPETQSQKGDPSAKPRIAKTEEVKPQKPTAEK